MDDNDDSPGAFRTCLNVGLARTSTETKGFAALKGAVDGRLDIPHYVKRSLEYDSEAKSLNDIHGTHIFGQHEADYTKNLYKEDEEDVGIYEKQSSRDIKLGVTPDSIEDIYAKAHTAIRADPSVKAKDDKKVTKKTTAAKIGPKARNAKVPAAKHQYDPEEEPQEQFSLKMGRIRSRKPGKKASIPRKGTTIFGGKKGTLWKLRRAGYGLGKAGKEWYRSFVTRFPGKAVVKDPKRNVVRILKKPATKFSKKPVNAISTRLISIGVNRSEKAVVKKKKMQSVASSKKVVKK